MADRDEKCSTFSSATYAVDAEVPHVHGKKINKRGQVRPTRYNSKFSKLSTTSTDLVDEGGVVPHDIPDDMSPEDQETRLLSEDPSSDPETRLLSEDPSSDRETTLLSEDPSSDRETTLMSEDPYSDQGIDSSEPEDEANNGRYMLQTVIRHHTTNVDELVDEIKQDNDWRDEPDLFMEDEFLFNEEAEQQFSLDDDTVLNADNTPIYPGHFLSITNSMLLISLYITTHSLTGVQISDLLALLNIHFLVKHPALESLYKFRHYVRNIQSPLVKHYFCSFCSSPVEKDAELCTNRFCLKDVTGRDGKSYFIEIPIEKQLINLFKRDSFRENLKHRFRRIKKVSGNIEDIYDSILYRSLSENEGPLSEKFPNNLSFVMNTDGVPIFSSSKLSIWPIFLMVNELPYKMRKRRENMMMCALWFGTSKPFMPHFCEPLHNSLLQLEHGVNVDVETEVIRCQAFLLCLSADLPARSAVENVNQFNGEYSCIKCKQQGKNFRTEAGGNIHIYPYNEILPDGPKRSHKACVQDASLALDLNKAVCGFKGPSFLLFCPAFDIVKGTGIDYMHQVLLGITRLFLKLWFNVSHSTEPFSLYNDLAVVDSRIVKLKPPHTITRMPRSISEHLKYWKAAELRSWLLYYSIPCVHDLLPQQYLYHYCALVEAIYILLKDTISVKEIDYSQRLLQYFVFMMPALYGERYLTLNIHGLLHLPKCVKDLGPLWVTSCFSFENANGELLRLFHGTQDVQIQIVNAVNEYQLLPLIFQAIPQNSPAYDLASTMSCNKKLENMGTYRMLGVGYIKELEVALEQHIVLFLQQPLRNGRFYARAVIRGLLFHSKDYTRVSVRNSFTVKYVDNKGKKAYGFLQWFARHESGLDHIYFCCIEKLQPCTGVNNSLHGKLTSENQLQTLQLSLPHVYVAEKCTGDQIHEIIKVDKVLDLCICIDIGDVYYICEEPNHQERNL